ncbi:hypothetical protein PM082_014698 [Marasmius tenuissimus]|nr:hypothetical protein PM082_014698 [Marasmius tenuissimus]
MDRRWILVLCLHVSWSAVAALAIGRGFEGGEETSNTRSGKLIVEGSGALTTLFKHLEARQPPWAGGTWDPSRFSGTPPWAHGWPGSTVVQTITATTTIGSEAVPTAPTNTDSKTFVKPTSQHDPSFTATHTTSPTSVPTATDVAAASSSSNRPALVGGIVGGVLVLPILILLLLLWRKRRNKKKEPLLTPYHVHQSNRISAKSQGEAGERSQSHRPTLMVNTNAILPIVAQATSPESRSREDPSPYDLGYSKRRQPDFNTPISASTQRSRTYIHADSGWRPPRESDQSVVEMPPVYEDAR